jgi:hypothetical protein
MVIGQPAPGVCAVVDTVDEAMREQRPSHGRSTMPRAWLALCVTAVLVTTSMGWARVARTSLGTSALAALSWRFRHRKIPWDERLGARVRVILRHAGLTCGSLVIDETDHQRCTSANTRAHLDQRRDQASGGSVWGPSRRLLLVVTPTITLPVGLTFYQPAPALRAWDTQENALKKPGVPPQQRPPPPPPTPPSLPTHALALRL